MLFIHTTDTLCVPNLHYSVDKWADYFVLQFFLGPLKLRPIHAGCAHSLDTSPTPILLGLPPTYSPYLSPFHLSSSKPSSMASDDSHSTSRTCSTPQGRHESRILS